MISESTLYLISCIISKIAFIVSMIYVYYHPIKSYQTVIILLRGIISLAKSVEYFEQYVFKSKNKPIKTSHYTV